MPPENAVPGGASARVHELLFAAAMFAALAYWPFQASPPVAGLVALKAAPATLLALAAALGARDGAGWLLAGSMAFGAAGDVLMEQPDGFIGALAAFLCAHLLTLALLLRLGERTWTPAGGRVALLLACAAVAAYAAIATTQRSPVVPALAYGTALAAVGVLAWQSGLPRRVGLGAMAFMASDSLIGLSVFVMPGTRWAASWETCAPCAIWPLYAAAQLLLFSGLMRAIAQRLRH